MLATLAQAVAGDEYSDEEEEEEPSSDAPAVRAEQPAGGGFNLWGIANAVAETVKKGTAELATTVRETDWRAEIQAFGRDVVEETEELGQSAISAVEHAVEHVEHLPQHAQTALPVIEERRRQVQEQLGQYGSHIGRFGRDFVANTTELFEQARDTIQQEMASAAAQGRPQRGPHSGRGGVPGAKYSRLDSDIAAMQRDSSTYCDEPADTDAYNAWLQTFDLERKKADIDAVVRDNTFMAELQARIVPLIVEHDTFWRRYFYRLHLLKEAHAQRAALAARAAAPPVEEVGWDDDDPASPQAAHSAVKPQASAQEAGQPGSHDAGQTQVGSRDGDTSPVSSGVAVSSAAQPSDEEPATASDSSSGADPWTVVTSPSRRTALSLPAAVPELAAEQAGEPDVNTQPPADDATPQQSGSTEPAAAEPAAAASSVEAAGNQGGPAPSAQPVAKPQSSAAVAPAEPPAASAPQQIADDGVDDNEDDDLGDIEAAPNGDDDDDVDEDWGYEST